MPLLEDHVLGKGASLEGPKSTPPKSATGSNPPERVDRRIDFRAAHEILRAGRATPDWVDGWLPSTWNDPESWKRGLYASISELRGGAVKGRPGESIDLYHDCLLAQVGKRRPALVVRDDDVAEWTFESLHERASALAGAWQAAGVKAGECVAIVLPVGVEYAVALLAALRLGLVAAPLPPLGATFVRSRIERLAPDRFVSTGRQQRMLAPGTAFLPLSPSSGAGGGGLGTSHAYADDDPVLRLLSPFGPIDADPVELTAGTLHEALLRDALLVLALQPGDKLAAPGFDPLQMQPLAMLTAWVAGASWVEMEPRHLEVDPKLLSSHGVTVLGVSRAMREVLLRVGPERVPASTSWFRAMNDVFDYERWAQLSSALAARKVSAFAVLTNAASGGAHLFTPRSLDPSPARAWPAPGRVFQLSQVGAGTLPSLTESGTYAPLLGKEPDASLLEVVLAKHGAGWTLGGSLAPGPEGRTVPAREIACAAERHPDVRAAAVVVAPGRWINDAHVVLLLFVEPEPGAELVRPVPIAEIKTLVRQEMGERHVPTRVETFALRPRFTQLKDKRVVDFAWVRSQYLSGALSWKSRSPLFAASARLCWIFDVERRRP